MLACLWMSILALIDSFQNVLSLRVLFDYLCALSLRFLGIITSAWLILLINPSLVRYHLYNFFGWNFTLFFFVNSHHMNVIMTANSHDICNTNLQNFNIYIDYEFTTIFNLYFLSFYILYGMQIRVCFYFLWFPWSCVLMSLSPPFCASNFQQKRGWMLRFNGTLPTIDSWHIPAHLLLKSPHFKNVMTTFYNYICDSDFMHGMESDVLPLF